MVPSARLELAQLSPLPPQDSVSTNFTTTAAFKSPDGMRRHMANCSPKTSRVYPENGLFPERQKGISKALLRRNLRCARGWHHRCRRHGGRRCNASPLQHTACRCGWPGHAEIGQQQGANKEDGRQDGRTTGQKVSAACSPKKAA